jgi:undecaprenyl-diphosphatase
VGTLVAFGSGMAAIAWLLSYLRSRTTLVFVVYRVALGVLLLVLLQAGKLQPMSGVENMDVQRELGKQQMEKQITD